MDLKETQSKDSKRNSNHGLKRKTTETKRDWRWACGAKDRWLWWCDNGGANIDEEDSGGETWRWSTSSAIVDVLSGGDGIGGRWLMGRQQLSVDLWVSAAGGLAWVTFPSFLFFFIFIIFFFCGLWVVGSVIRGGHGRWSLAWEVLLASLLAWGWKTHVGLTGIYGLQGLVWACSRSLGQKLERYCHL